MAYNQLKWRHDAPLVIAHRGASSIAPENTLPAFEAAVAQGADGIELDVKLSRDGVLVVHHDQTLDRTTNGSGPISHWDWTDLQTLEAGTYFADEYRGVGIPSLEEVFKTFGDQTLYNLELTEYQRPRTEITSKTIELVIEHQLERNVLYSSFNPLELMRAARRVERSALALLMHSATPSAIRILIKLLTPHKVYHPENSMVDETLVTSIHRSNQRINVWTVNVESRMRALLQWGVDGLITDDPALAVNVRRGMESR
jgi:glycerophosphoryl diester phosphodiesterase